ncbi:MAG: hypothetical protein HC880_07370, partial [Bacteroidia bacterium]|nr:hypothetical protein [Bacteroidia bacterium]
MANIADTYYKLAKYQNALNFAMQSLAIAQATGTNQGIQEASLILAEAYANVGYWREAYEYYEMHAHIKDSTFHKEKTREIQLIETKFAKEKREAEEKMRRERAEELARHAKKHRDNIQYSLIFLIFIGLFISIFIIGKFDIPQYYIESLIFLTLLLVFRFVLILLTSISNDISEGSPLVILGANVVLALLFMPLHKLLEGKLKKKVILEQSNED